MTDQRRRVVSLVALFSACAAAPAFAGPPYQSDDPEPTEYQHYEIYGFTSTAHTPEGWAGVAGIDFNYGATRDIQLTAVLPVEYDHSSSGALIGGVGNIELAAKIRVAHQADIGWDIAVFPRVFLPSASDRLGEDHASFLLPVWIGRDDGPWSTFGGGGCALHQGGDARNFCQAGWALTREVTPALRLGGEAFYQTADTRGAHASTSIGVGAIYDINDTLHVLGSLTRQVGDVDDGPRTSFYASLLFTF